MVVFGVCKGGTDPSCSTCPKAHQVLFMRPGAAAALCPTGDLPCMLLLPLFWPPGCVVLVCRMDAVTGVHQLV